MGLGLLPSYLNRNPETRKFFSGIISSLDGLWGHLNVELKHNDQASSGTLFTTPFFDDLCEISAGITGSQVGARDVGFRDGDKIRVKTLNVKYELTNTGTAGNTQVANIMLIKHYDNFADIGPLFADIYDTFSTDNTNYHLMQRMNERKSQYKILYSRRHYLSDDIGTGNKQYGTIFLAPQKRVGTFIEWEGVQATDPSNGKYYLITWSDDSSTVDIDWTSRVTYIDN